MFSIAASSCAASTSESNTAASVPADAATIAPAAESDADEAATVATTVVDAADSTDDRIEQVDDADSEVAETAEVTTTTTIVLSNAPIPAAETELRSGNVAYGGGNPDGSLVQALSREMPTVDGQMVDVSQFLGNDVVLWFWAPWCSWCNAEAPRVSQMAVEFDERVEIVGVAGVSPLDGMQGFVERHSLQHITHLADLDGRFWVDLDVTYQPWWMFVNDDGTVLGNWQGRLSEDEIRDWMQQLEAA